MCLSRENLENKSLAKIKWFSVFSLVVDCFSILVLHDNGWESHDYVRLLNPSIGATIWKLLLSERRFLRFYDKEEHFLEDLMTSSVFKQYYLSSHLDILRYIRFVWINKAEPNSNRSQSLLSNDQV